MNNIIEHSQLIVDEKVTIRCNQYTIYDTNQRIIGHAEETKNFLRYLLNRQMIPLTLNIYGADDQLITSLHRGWTFWLPKWTVSDSTGNVIALLKSKLKLFKSETQILNPNGYQIATIFGDWKAWEFVINDADNRQIGSISKQWNGAMKEIFTTADKYLVSLEPTLTDPMLRTIVASVAIVVDSMFKESK